MPLTHPTVERRDNDNDNDSSNSNINSCNLSASWIDLETSFDSKEETKTIRGNGSLPIVVDDLHFADAIADIDVDADPVRIVAAAVAVSGEEENDNGEGEGNATIGDNCHCVPLHPQQEQESQQKRHPQQKDRPEPSDVSRVDDTCVESFSSHQPYVEIIDTQFETVEGYDWEGILDLRNRTKQQQQQQQQQHQQQQRSITALRWVTEFRLYLTDGPLEETTKEASLALDDTPRYEIVEPETVTDEIESSVDVDVDVHVRPNPNVPSSITGEEHERSHESCGDEDRDGFVEFIESSPKVNTTTGGDGDKGSSSKESAIHDENEEDGFASLALSPLDVLTNSLSSARAFRERHDNIYHGGSVVRLTELIVGGPSLSLSEFGIERLARGLALACGGRSGSKSDTSALKKLVLIVSAVDLPAMTALGECFRATKDSLEDLHFYASRTTERLVGSRHRYKRVPAESVLGPGISSWVDAWTCDPSTHWNSSSSSSHNHGANNRLRSLNLSRMDLGDEAAFALSRLLLAAPRLRVLNLAQDDFNFYGGPKPKPTPPEVQLQPQPQPRSTGTSSMEKASVAHPPLSFAGTKRLLESLILIEDIKQRYRLSLSSSSLSSSSMLLPLSCSNLLELDISGWILEDDERKSNGDDCDDDDYDDKAIDNFYDDYNYIDDGGGNEDFDFPDAENSCNGNNSSSGNINISRNRAIRKNQRACCVIASMLRVNTTLEKLVLVAENGGNFDSSEAVGGARGFLSVRSTLAIARALRDRVSRGRYQQPGRHSDPHGRPLGSNLRTLVLSTNYNCTGIQTDNDDASSWVIQERKRAVAKVFFQALKDRPIHELRLQELSCTRTFQGQEPLGGGVTRSANANTLACHRSGGDSASAIAITPTPPNDLRDQIEFFLQRNRSLNQSLKKIDSFWRPRLSSLDARGISGPSDGEDDEDDDCDFVEAIEQDTHPTGATSVSAARFFKPQRINQNPPPVLVRTLPVLMARAGREAARHDVVFHCTMILATRTNLWEVAAEHRRDKPFRYRFHTNHDL